MASDKMTVLLIEDNFKLNEINRRALEKGDYTVLTAQTLTEARQHLAQTKPDVIVLDVVLPDGNGFDFCAEIRDTTDAHILFLTSRREHEDKLRGLSLGGDDYITKPFKLDELILRIAVATRRRQINSMSLQTIQKGNLKLDIIAGQAFVGGEDRFLTKKEFALLMLFVQNEEKVMSTEILYEKAWGQPMNNNTGAVKYQVSNLRKKLEGSGYTISSARGEGYYFKNELN